MKHIAKRLLSLLLVVCLVLSVAVIPAGAAETKLTSVYASYAAEGHTNAPVEDDVFEAKSDSITVSIMTTTDMHGRAYDWNSYTNSALSNNFLQAAKLVAERRAAVDDSILIDVGDILQGSALSSYNILQEGGENSPMATALRYIGYDAFVLGNHEFNYAPQIQWNYYNLLTSTDKAVAGQPGRRHLLERRGDGDERIRVLPVQDLHLQVRGRHDLHHRSSGLREHEQRELGRRQPL